MGGIAMDMKRFANYLYYNYSRISNNAYLFMRRLAREYWPAKATVQKF